MPSFQDLFDARFGFAVARNTLHQVRVMRLGVYCLVVDVERRGGHLARTIELLTMPHQIIVPEQVARNPVKSGTGRENYHLPEIVHLKRTPKHPPRQLVAVRSAFRQKPESMRKKMLALITRCGKFRLPSRQLVKLCDHRGLPVDRGHAKTK